MIRQSPYSRSCSSIEGYHVTLSDAVAAVERDEPLEADARTWAEIVGYRTALTCVQQRAEDRHFHDSDRVLADVGAGA